MVFDQSDDIYLQWPFNIRREERTVVLVILAAEWGKDHPEPVNLEIASTKTQINLMAVFPPRRPQPILQEDSLSDLEMMDIGKIKSYIPRDSMMLSKGIQSAKDQAVCAYCYFVTKRFGIQSAILTS